MGTTGVWVAVKAGERRTELKEALRTAQFESEGQTRARGWVRASRDRDLPEWNEFDDLIAGFSSTVEQPALGGWVFDSDVGYLVAVRPGGEVASRLLIGESAASSYGVSMWPLDWRSKESEAFAHWSQDTPRRVDASLVLEILSREWTFAEEGIEELFESVGLALAYPPRSAYLAAPRGTDAQPLATIDSIDARGLGTYEDPLPGETETCFLAGERIPWRDMRYVLGLGESFVGVWDRRSPAAPIERFRRSYRGEMDARAAWERLVIPVLVEILGCTRLNGFLEPLDRNAETDVAGRTIRWRDARFIAGHGVDFTGVWDRHSPEDAVHRFRKTKPGKKKAIKAVHRLLRSSLLQTVRLDGGRWRSFGRFEFHGSAKETPIWLLTEEGDPDPPWSVDQFLRLDGGPFFLYRVSRDATSPDEVSAWLLRTFPTFDAAVDGSRRWGAKGSWTPIPPEVPRGLGETAEWILDSLSEAERAEIQRALDDPDRAGWEAMEELFALGQPVGCHLCMAQIGTAHSIEEAHTLLSNHVRDDHPDEYHRFHTG